ncbi:MAG: hypothetical protein A2700_00515 [Candidatus Blackburnbacteria bacterium RIFCSPHIGHO2_01_FULL_44_64]|nr:MAG: hypothetical protein A2700_00515 [Candidatus Blackburnbacteria bacterium RIFCSPHIGHO2_01_FULL_44_64]
MAYFYAPLSCGFYSEETQIHRSRNDARDVKATKPSAWRSRQQFLEEVRDANYTDGNPWQDCGL